MDVIGKQTLGAADEAAQSLSGQLAILSEVSNQAKERIGGALFEALGGVAGKDGAGGAAQSIENLSTKLSNAISGFGYLVREVKIAQPILVAAGIAIGLAWAPWFTALSVAALAIGAIGNAMRKNQPQIAVNTGPLMFPTAGDGGYKEREAARKKAENEAIARNKQLAKLIKDQAKSAADLVKQKRLQAAIDKANAVLNKGEEVFDLDKIQIAAALTNQAELLGKSTDQTQRLQIANDTARLNVKRDILALEDAIASKDEKAIIAATNKLNEDLKILGALNKQDLKMQDIKSILDSLQPKDLINLENLDAALKKIEDMLKLLAMANAQAKAPVPTSGSLGSGIPAGDYIAPISTVGGSIGAILEYADAAAARANAFADLLDMDTAAKTQALQSSPLYDNSGALQSFRQKESATYNVTIQANTIANPDELVNLVQDSLIKLNRRGDSLVQAGAL
jgi:hypothetical protein